MSADRDQREALIERLREQDAWLMQCGLIGSASRCTEAADTLAAMLAELDEARRDAERWQTYRSAGGDLTLRLHNLRSDQRDAAIDAARAKEKEQGNG